MNNSELWKSAETGEIKTGDVFIDQEGSEIIFTGKSFQVYFTEKDDRYEYVGLCVGDVWKYSHNDIQELELQKTERR